MMRRSNGRTPLHSAAAFGHAACVKELLALGADPEAKADDGSKPVDLVTKSCSLWRGRRRSMMRSSSCSTRRRRRARARARRSRRLDERGLVRNRMVRNGRTGPLAEGKDKCSRRRHDEDGPWRSKKTRRTPPTADMEPWFVFLVVIFIGTGVMQPLLISTLGNLGAYDKSTLLFLLPNYAAAAVSHATTSSRLARSDGRRWPYSAQSTCSRSFSASMVSRSPAALCTLSSIRPCTMWIAVESRILIKRKLAAAQWLGCAIVVAGLAITGGNVASTFGDKSGADIALGASFILFGSVSHALTWVLVEMMLKGEVDPVLPEAISAIMGGAGVRMRLAKGGGCVFGLWQLVYTLPRAEELVHQPIASHGGHIGEITTRCLHCADPRIFVRARGDILSFSRKDGLRDRRCNEGLPGGCGIHRVARLLLRLPRESMLYYREGMES